MTKFLYISDTHIGAGSNGFQQQPRDMNALPKLIAALAEVCIAEKVDAVLHGGDMVDVTSEQTLKSAADIFGELPVPTYLCLGNHDLTEPDALSMWMDHAPMFFLDGRAEFSIKQEDCVVHILPNQWCNQLYYWEWEQDPHVTDAQVSWLFEALSVDLDLPHILVTHSPVFGVPKEQTGLDTPFHDPGRAFNGAITRIVQAHPSLKCVLGGHNHINMCVLDDGVPYVTASSLVETPFEYKLLEIGEGQVHLNTHGLSPQVWPLGEYNHGKAYIQGRPCDRHLTLSY